jgi:hypothetical protein
MPDVKTRRLIVTLGWDDADLYREVENLLVEHDVVENELRAQVVMVTIETIRVNRGRARTFDVLIKLPGGGDRLTIPIAMIK